MENSIEYSQGQKAAFKREFNEFKDNTKKLLDSYKQTIEEIRQLKTQFIDGTTSNPSIKSIFDEELSDLSEKKIEIEKKVEELEEYHQKIFEGDDEDESVLKLIETLKEDIEEKASDIKSQKEEIDNFYEKIFGKKDGEKLIVKGYKQQFDDKISNIAKTIETEEIKYKTLFEKIEGLLPGATSVGLSKALKTQKDSYTAPIVIWSIVFILTVIGMICFGLHYIEKITDYKTIEESVIGFVNRLPFFIPTVWLAFFASKQLSQVKRLKQEYAFKETFANAFDGHKKQIEDLSYDTDTENKLMETLLNSLIKILSSNPSNTLESKSHNDKPPILDFLNKSRSKDDNKS